MMFLFGLGNFSSGPDGARRLRSSTCAEGIDAVAYSADAGDEHQLTAALDSVEQKFGGVDVLEFSPMPFTEMPRFTAATTTVGDTDVARIAQRPGLPDLCG